MSAFDIITIGESLRDVFYLIHDATVQCMLNTDDCLLCLHYAEKIPVDHVVKVPAAGNSANAAVCSARLGHKSALLTWIGDDYGGRHIHEHLAREHVDTLLVMTDKKHPTSESTIVNFQGEKTQLVYFQPRKYNLPKLPETRCIYYSAMGNGFNAFDQKLQAYLKKHPEIFFVFQPGTTHIKLGLTPSFKRFVARSDLFILNREEAAMLLKDGTEVKARIKAFHHLGAKRVIITDGKNGSYGSDAARTWYVPAFPAKPRETTGAGDSFAATVTSYILMKRSFEEAMRAGSAMAANVIEHVGPQTGLMKQKELSARLNASRSIHAKKID